jgi:23S rRNA pseudouridine1911/1915/1917 synthase
MSAPWPILYEDNHLLAVVKPAMLPTMGVAADRPSLLGQAKEYIKRKYAKPGNVYLGVVSRLDAPVTGVIVLARTSKAAARLTEQLRTRRMEKIYWAIVEGRVEGDIKAGETTLVDWVRKDERHRRMHIAAGGGAGGQEARLSYRVLQSLRGGALVEVRLETGRKHQIRLQLSHAGHPIVGDRKYGARGAFPVGIALHARRLTLTHPVRGEPLELVAPLPASWKKLGLAEA